MPSSVACQFNPRALRMAEHLANDCSNQVQDSKGEYSTNLKAKLAFLVFLMQFDQTGIVVNKVREAFAWQE